MRERGRRDHVQPAWPHHVGELGDQRAERAVRGDDQRAAPHGAGGADQPALVEVGGDGGLLDDRDSPPFENTGERAQPSDGVQRRVVVGHQARAAGPPQRLRQLGLLDQPPGEAVLRERALVLAHVTGLLGVDRGT